MPNQPHELAWKLYAELRKELVETQKTRAQVIGYKITLVGAGVGTVAPVTAIFDMY